GAVYQRRGNRDPLACPHGAYPCAGEDRWCVIAVFNDRQWRSLREAMGGPPWAVRPEYATFMSRKTHEEALDDLISKWTRGRSPEEVMELLQEKGVPSGVVHSSEGLYGDLQLKHRGHFVTIEHPEMGRHHYDGYSFKLSRTPGQLRSPAPLMGQHNELVLRDILGLDEEEIGGLAEVGALE
ncbi:MAG: CoA transferase, partial [Chloroflexi bacterium]|nr:CoA transferase [Chloroflexota bacterium]